LNNPHVPRKFVLEGERAMRRNPTIFISCFAVFTCGRSALPAERPGAAAASHTSNAATAVSDDRSLTVRVYSTGIASPGLLTDGMAVSRTVLRAAGITPVWIRCMSHLVVDSACTNEAADDEVIVRIRAGAYRRGDGRCGQTVWNPAGRSQLVTIHIGCVGDVADSQGVTRDVVFGFMLAHEIGHVLAGPEHRPLGIMQAVYDATTWDRAAHGSLMFHKDEAETLRQALATRHGQARGVGLNDIGIRD